MSTFGSILTSQTHSGGYGIRVETSDIAEAKKIIAAFKTLHIEPTVAVSGNWRGPPTPEDVADAKERGSDPSEDDFFRLSASRTQVVKLGVKGKYPVLARVDGREVLIRPYLDEERVAGRIEWNKFMAGRPSLFAGKQDVIEPLNTEDDGVIVVEG
jgi:hypothetical protein